MKTKLFLIAMFVMTANTLFAQSDESNYLILAMEKIGMGECDN